MLGEVVWELAFFDPLDELNEDVEGVCLEAGGLATVEGGDVVHDGLRGEGSGFDDDAMCNMFNS